MTRMERFIRNGFCFQPCDKDSTAGESSSALLPCSTAAAALPDSTITTAVQA
jgi:hypothetical protein